MKDLRELRISKGISLEKMARGLGVSPGEWSSVEDGKVRLTPGGKRIVERLLNCRIVSQSEAGSRSPGRSDKYFRELWERAVKIEAAKKQAVEKFRKEYSRAAKAARKRVYEQNPWALCECGRAGEEMKAPWRVSDADLRREGFPI